uniref:Uncharacterized protein n=1 Tax=Arundo donax TaxID=35708 RepID=A0A0A9BZS5_ARUDO
MMLLRILGMK